jgi:predicted transcriptional regulator
MGQGNRLGDLQLAILQVLWDLGEATAQDVAERLADRALAFTTFATMLRKMEARGLISHRSEGRQFVYRPLLREDEVRRSMVSDLTERLFAGDPTALVTHLLREEEIDPGELHALLSRLAELTPEERGDTDRGGAASGDGGA